MSEACAPQGGTAGAHTHAPRVVSGPAAPASPAPYSELTGPTPALPGRPGDSDALADV